MYLTSYSLAVFNIKASFFPLGLHSIFFPFMQHLYYFVFNVPTLSALLRKILFISVPQSTAVSLGTSSLLVPSSQLWANTSEHPSPVHLNGADGAKSPGEAVTQSLIGMVLCCSTHLCMHLRVQDRLGQQPAVEHSEHLEV